MSLTAAIEVPAGQSNAWALVINLRIINPADRRISILNPDMGVPSPAMNWPYSKEVYQTFLLFSFGYLSMSVSDEAGKELPRQEILMSATPALRPRLDLEPGDSFDVALPIGDFYQLMSGKTYQVAIEYGDQEQKVSARSHVIVP